jgi:copper chaperone CopZ
MKKILIIFLAVFLAYGANAQFTRATLQATGLTCAMCSNAINKALLKIPFVESVKPDIKNSSFNIVFRAGMETDIDALKAAVEDAGFSVGSLKLTGTFDGLSIDNDKHVKFGQLNFHFLNVKGQILNGEATVTVLDKDFVTAKQFKKLCAMSGMKCVETGKSAACCAESGVPAGSRIYHVTI